MAEKGFGAHPVATSCHVDAVLPSDFFSLLQRVTGVSLKTVGVCPVFASVNQALFRRQIQQPFWNKSFVDEEVIGVHRPAAC